MTTTFNDLTFMHHTDLVCITNRGKTVGDNDRSTVTPVSYTHLDVYKRQKLFRVSSSMTYVLLPFGLPPVRSVWLWNRVSIEMCIRDSH